MRDLRVASAIAAVFVAGGAVAQQPQPVKLDETQTLGRSLFLQSCGVCHLPPQLGAPRYAPRLSRDSAGGNANNMREVIANGTPRMPGFKSTFTTDQIAAIAAFLMTIPPASAAAPTTDATRGDKRDDY